jgi:hypothetical protein
MKIQLCFVAMFCFKLVASFHQDATPSHLRAVGDTPVEVKHQQVHDQRDLSGGVTGALTGLVLYDTSTKTNITLTNNMTIVSADPIILKSENCESEP